MVHGLSLRGLLLWGRGAAPLDSAETARRLSGRGSWPWGAALSSVVCRLRCSQACAVFLDQGLNLCPLCW